FASASRGATAAPCAACATSCSSSPPMRPSGSRKDISPSSTCCASWSSGCSSETFGRARQPDPTRGPDMIVRSTRLPLLLLAIVAAACGSEEAGPTAEQLRIRELAAREACIGERLALRAQDELQTLAQL